MVDLRAPGRAADHPARHRPQEPDPIRPHRTRCVAARRTNSGGTGMNNKLSPQTVDKIREILRANPGKTLHGTFVDGRSHYKLVGAVDEARRRRLRLLKARAHMSGRQLAKAREPARRLAALKGCARTRFLD